MRFGQYKPVTRRWSALGGGMASNVSSDDAAGVQKVQDIRLYFLVGSAAAPANLVITVVERCGRKSFYLTWFAADAAWCAWRVLGLQNGVDLGGSRLSSIDHFT
jgi:hypothetical protein